MQRILLFFLIISPLCAEEGLEVRSDQDALHIETDLLKASVQKKGYVTGVYRQSFVDKKTGFSDAGFGLDIVDWIMEPGSDEGYRDRLEPEMVYQFGNAYHGKRPKRSIEGPQICTKAGELDPEVHKGKDFIAVRQQFSYTTAAPGKKSGSTWRQSLVFPKGKRYFLSMDRIESVNASDGLFLRIDMPGHIRHKNGDTFSEIYLSYLGGEKGLRLPSSAFAKDFAPDEKYNYRRDRNGGPKRFIRAYKLRDPKTGQDGPWLAGMTLDPDVVHEAWCHQRGYVCMIQEFGGRPVKAGGSFSAAFIVGFFDSIDEMHRVYDEHFGATGLAVNSKGWKLTGRKLPGMRFDPVQKNIEGWTLHIDPALLAGEHAEEGAIALRSMRERLNRIKLLLDEERVKKMQTLDIWMERDHPRLRAMQYHPGAGWLKSNWHDPRLAKKVHVVRAAALTDRGQLLKHPFVILHELAHAYHDQVLSFNEPRIIRCFENAKKSGKYEKVLLYTGRTVKHYALSNHKEYFAECTEAYIGRNDFYPFVRAELKEFDPDMHDLLEEIWGKMR